MKIWNYIGEFFLFRWLFGKLKSTESNHDIVAHSKDILNDTGYLYSGSDSANSIHSETSDVLGIGETNSTDSQDCLDEMEELDDLDLFLRKNSSTNTNNKSDSGIYSSIGYHNNYDYLDNQSFDNFTEEQDDYDMMDDF